MYSNVYQQQFMKGIMEQHVAFEDKLMSALLYLLRCKKRNDKRSRHPLYNVFYFMAVLLTFNFILCYSGYLQESSTSQKGSKQRESERQTLIKLCKFGYNLKLSFNSMYIWIVDQISNFISI